MPSTNQAGGDQDVTEFPNLEDDLGHNPARFLDWEIVGAGSHDKAVANGRSLLLKARIRGIDRIAAVRAYKAVERHPDVGPTTGPREGVIRLLDQREEFLEEHGEREDNWEYGPRRPPEMVDTESAFPGPDTSATDKLHRGRQAATDGGSNTHE